ncbi:MAG: hypothetical protein MUC93_05530 [Bacteroidales bacterium]|nr:hypothetical protein [Bacteroidales bacterium]
MNKTYGINVDKEKSSKVKTGFNPAIRTLMAEGGLSFYRYLTSINLSRESDILVLPSNHHYYYDGKELKDVRILINLKKLNLIKHLDMFLNTLVRILPPETNFIGCFSDSNTLKRNGFPFYHPSRLFNRLNNFLDFRTDQIMNKNEVSELLKRNGFRTIDMKEMNGLTYFYSRKVINQFN